MLDDRSDELLFGLWPFLKRALMLFIPLWVYLLCWSAGAPYFVSSISAGLSVATIVFYEKYKIKQVSDNEYS